MLQHELTFLEFVNLALQFLCLTLGAGRNVCRIQGIGSVFLKFSFRHSAADRFLDYPVNEQIRVAADWRCKVAVITERQSEMSVTLRAVIGLFHRPEHDTVHHRLIRLILNLRDDVCKRLRVDIVRAAFQVDTEIHQISLQIHHFLRVRLFVDAVEERVLHPIEVLRHGFVCRKHELLNHAVCGSSLCGPDFNRVLIRIQNNLRLRNVKIETSLLLTLVSEDCRKLAHFFKVIK